MRTVSIDELKSMTDTEGLILQGCGGDLQEWVDGINEMLTDEQILQNGSTFTDVASFEHGGLTNLLFNMDNVDLNVGKLAMWRIATHGNFGGTWLSDYRVNRLGMDDTEQTFKPQKPDCALIGEDGNIFNLLGIASRTLRKNDQSDALKEMSNRVHASGSYDEALCIIGDYVNITCADEEMQMGGQSL